MGSGNLNPGPYANIVSSLPNEPSPQPFLPLHKEHLLYGVNLTLWSCLTLLTFLSNYLGVRISAFVSAQGKNPSFYNGHTICALLTGH